MKARRPQTFQNLLDMELVLERILRIDEDIVHICRTEIVQIFHQYVVDVPLE